uniref:legumain n=1 Tax=Sipha flava TaxID=143950 RepID=A0A2S2QIZ0_9HEMI
MLNNKLKYLWIILTLSLILVLLTIFIAAMIIKIGPSNFIDKCLELLESKRETWVILVAGSKGWYNYRHQADVAHAYQILLNNGLRTDHIIVMMTDDVAYDIENPFPGQLFNSPTGSNVHQGLRVDYNGEDVNSDNFLHVLTGNKIAMQNIGSGRVIESKERDNIFVNFVGHGSSGILAFPKDYLYADELNITLNSMYKSGKFHRMLLYVEACKAGSLFDGILSESSNIFAVTAAGPRESSWSIYCSGDDDNETSIICLGDEFSVTWIEDQDNVKIGVFYPGQVNEFFETRTVLNHFNHVRNLVKLSNVMPYGDFNVGQDKLSSYIGKPSGVFSTNFNHYNTQSSTKNNNTNEKEKNLKNSTKLYQLSKNRIGVNNTMNKRKQYSENNKIMKNIMDQIFDAILQGVIKRWPGFIGNINELKKLPRNLPLNVFPCYRRNLDLINENCFSLPKVNYLFYE